jgi:hypothetical protein
MRPFHIMFASRHYAIRSHGTKESSSFPGITIKVDAAPTIMIYPSTDESRFPILWEGRFKCDECELIYQRQSTQCFRMFKNGNIFLGMHML